MKLTRAQKRAKLQAASEALIERMLDWDELNERPKLTEIEDEVLAMRQQFGEEVAGVLLEGQASRQPVENPTCEQCGQAMRYKGQKRKDVESRLGGMAVERGYYYCTNCASGFFPPRPTT